MNKRMVSLITQTAFVAAFALCYLGVARADGAPSPNIVQNPGFESWAVITDLGNPPIKTDAGSMPVSWDPDAEAPDPKVSSGTYSCGVFKDTIVKHGGNASVRIESGRTVDIGGIIQQMDLEPNTKYQVTAWYKGDNIVVDGDAGVFIWAVYGPKDDYWNHMTFWAKKPDVHDGTFDWTLFKDTFDTNATAGTVRLTLQLRKATGKLWFDDIEVRKIGPVTPVKSF